MGNMRFKVGDRVQIKSIDWYNENKDEYEYIDCGKHLFYPLMSQYCGNIFTISDVYSDFYQMYENRLNWTDEMIECKVEEECPQDFIEKYCKSCGTQRCDRTKEFLDGCPHYNAYMCKKQNNAMEDENNPLIETVVDTVRESNDRYRIVIDPRFDIEVDEGEYYAVRRKKEYPKTYEECCEILGCCSYNVGFDRCETSYEEILHNKILTLRKLLICRDAYWKIAGDEMGLDKPWEPDWNNVSDKYCIYFVSGNAWLKECQTRQCFFAFPTAEMRDAFYENFKEEIEKCKEFL